MKTMINRILDTVAPKTDRIHVYSAMTTKGRKNYITRDSAIQHAISPASVMECDLIVKIPREINVGADAHAYVCRTYHINEN